MESHWLEATLDSFRTCVSGSMFLTLSVGYYPFVKYVPNFFPICKFIFFIIFSYKTFTFKKIAKTANSFGEIYDFNISNYAIFSFTFFPFSLINFRGQCFKNLHLIYLKFHLIYKNFHFVYVIIIFFGTERFMIFILSLSNILLLV